MIWLCKSNLCIISDGEIAVSEKISCVSITLFICVSHFGGPVNWGIVEQESECFHWIEEYCNLEGQNRACLK